MYVSGSSNSSYAAYSFAAYVSKMAALGLAVGGAAALVKQLYMRYSNREYEHNGAQKRTGNITSSNLNVLSISSKTRPPIVVKIFNSRDLQRPDNDDVTVCFKCGTFVAYSSEDAEWKTRGSKMILSFPKLKRECHINDNGIFKLLFENGIPILTRTKNHCNKNFKKEPKI